MKKIFPFIICALLLEVSCTQQSTELTDEQKATIISEVGKDADNATSAAMQLNFEVWCEYWSEDEFISVTSDINLGTNFYDNRNVWVDLVANNWSGVESRSYESLEKRITPLSLNLALVSRTTHGSSVLKNEEKITFTYQGTSIWKKEEEGWKIIQLHESVHVNPIEE